MAKKIVGTFCEKAITPKKVFAPASFRWKKSGRAWLITGCEKSAWQPKKKRCKTGLKAYILLAPLKGKKRCARGQKRIKK